MAKLLLQNAKIIDVMEKKVTDGDVLILDGIISEIGANLEVADAEVVDLCGKALMPGLFNCHVHMCLDAAEEEHYYKSVCEMTVEALTYFKQYLESGVTFIRDVGGINFLDLELKKMAKAGRVLAPDMQVSAKCICMTGGHGWEIAREADGPADCRMAAREQLKAGADWVKVMATGGVMTNGVEPGSPQLTEEELRAAIEEAHKVGAKTATHAQGMTGIKNALRAGIDSIEHGFYMDDWCFEWMKEHDVYYVPTLAAMYWIKVNGTAAGIADYVVRKVENAFDDHKATFLNAYKSGVKIVLGTDAGTPFNDHSMTAHEILLMERAGMEPWDALRAGTIVAAQMCGVDAVCGSIEVGKKANLAVFAENPLENLETVLDCQMTVLNGKIVHKK